MSMAQACLAVPAWWAVMAFTSCSAGMSGGENGSMQDTNHYAHTNRLARETSPYLLQHAHNPVDWFPWGTEAFDSARAQNKLVLVSIGYSSCHWCHVMERESFENDSIAKLMNERFICIKVDREERPDVDQVYMTAVQLMTGRGGWPLNCFALPDGRPCYGGTYYPAAQWTQLLTDLSETWKRDPKRVFRYAEQLHQGVKDADLVELNEAPPQFTRREVDDLVRAWEPQFDHAYGGADRAPKFPMPNNYEFLLRYGRSAGNGNVLEHVRVTLDHMAMGGIFDQVGGGFSRYSTDVLWKVPHFEKMLYDNAQLVSLYSQAFQAFQDPLYRDVVERTLTFIEREMTSPEGSFYSALDADSEGEEGRYYTWTAEELRTVLGEDYPFAEDYYNVNTKGLWEEGRYILLRTMTDDAFAEDRSMDGAAVRETVRRINGKLLQARETRIRPGLDDKSLISWNAMMVTALCDARNALGDDAYLRKAARTMDLLLTGCRREDGGLWHSYKAGRATINGYLEDYAFVMDALLTLYQSSFEERWLNEARRLAAYVIAHFHDESSGMFHFTSDLDPPLIARKMEVTDNVMPSSNSTMARALFVLGHLLEEPRYLEISSQQLNNVTAAMIDHPSGYSNWAQLLLAHAFPFHEIAITGPDALRRRKEFGGYYIPNRMFLGATTTSDLPLLKDKFLGGTTIFVCENKVCQLPVTTVAEALKQL